MTQHLIFSLAQMRVWSFHIKAHQSRRKFAPKCTNKAKNLHQQGQKICTNKNCTKGNHYNKASNKNRVGLHIFRALLTPTGENKGGYWLRQDLRATLPVSAHTARTKFAPHTGIMWKFTPIPMHLLDIFLHWQDIAKNAIVYSLAAE